MTVKITAVSFKLGFNHLNLKCWPNLLTHNKQINCDDGARL